MESQVDAAQVCVKGLADESNAKDFILSGRVAMGSSKRVPLAPKGNVGKHPKGTHLSEPVQLVTQERFDMTATAAPPDPARMGSSSHLVGKKHGGRQSALNVTSKGTIQAVLPFPF